MSKPKPNPYAKQRLNWKFNEESVRDGEHYACEYCYLVERTAEQCTRVYPTCSTISLARFPVPINHLIPNPILWRAEDELKLKLK